MTENIFLKHIFQLLLKTYSYKSTPIAIKINDKVQKKFEITVFIKNSTEKLKKNSQNIGVLLVKLFNSVFLVVTRSDLFFWAICTPTKVPKWSPTLSRKHFLNTFFDFLFPSYSIIHIHHPYPSSISIIHIHHPSSSIFIHHHPLCRPDWVISSASLSLCLADLSFFFVGGGGGAQSSCQFLLSQVERKPRFMIEGLG